jgi:hypothetical protein
MIFDVTIAATLVTGAGIGAFIVQLRGRRARARDRKTASSYSRLVISRLPDQDADISGPLTCAADLQIVLLPDEPGELHR